MNFQEQVKAFLAQKKKSVLVENLFYTSSNFSFQGVLKLWLYDTSGAGVFVKPAKEGAKHQGEAPGDNAGEQREDELTVRNSHFTLPVLRKRYELLFRGRGAAGRTAEPD